MAEIGFSRPKGRITVSFPDDMSIADLRATLTAHLDMVERVRRRIEGGEQSNPPRTGVKMSSLLKEGQGDDATSR